MINPNQKNSLKFQHADEVSLLELPLSEVSRWRLRYDKVCFSVTGSNWYYLMQDLIIHLSDKTEDSNIKFKISEHRSPTYQYKRVKKFESDSHRIEFFYNRIPTPYVTVNCYVRVTVVKKDSLTYLNHARLLLDIENILKSYDYHVCSVELALDCSLGELKLRDTRDIRQLSSKSQADRDTYFFEFYEARLSHIQHVLIEKYPIRESAIIEAFEAHENS